MKVIKLLLLLQILLISSPIFGQVNNSIIANHFKSENFDCAIFPKEYYGDFLDKGRFTPTKNEVKLAEEALQKNFKKINHKLINQNGSRYSPIIHKNLQKYKRQYFGYLDKNGNKILYINAFWSNEGSFDDWLYERVFVFDGGSFYWNIKYNLNKQRLFELHVNGNA